MSSTTSDQEIWDQRWRDPSFSPLWWVDGPHDLIRKTVESGWLPRHCTVLELGCGAGQQAAWLKQAGFEVIGIDVSPEAIARARRDFTTPGGPVFEVADVTGPHILRRTFDAIVDAGCFHGIRPEHHARYVNHVASWSRENTRFVLMVHCREHSPIVRLHQIRQLFEQWFDVVFYEARAGCLPQDPRMKMMVFRLLRRKLGSKSS